jgi:hypothetical protein
MRTLAWLRELSKWFSGFVNKVATVDPGLQISEMFLGLLFLVPGVLGLFYLLWSVHPLFALFVEFAAVVTILVLLLEMFNNILSHS